MTKVSVIVPAYNAEKTIHKCISSLLDSEYGDLEIIAIDDRSTDRTREILESFDDYRLRLCINDVNSGASFSRNWGVKKSKGDLVVFLDSDSYVEKNWVEQHAKAHHDIPADLIGGGIIGVHKTIFGKCDAFCNWWTSIPYSKSFYLEKLHLPTNNISIKREVFQKIGCLNEELRLGGEDAEFCHRALKHGLKIYFKADLTVFHFDRDDFEGFIKHQEHWGKHAVKMRKGMNMDYSFLMPSSYFIAFFYILPLAILYTAFIAAKWAKYKPSVLIFSPVIFIGKIKQAIAIKDSFRSDL